MREKSGQLQSTRALYDTVQINSITAMQAPALPPWSPAPLPPDAPPLWLQAARLSVAAGFPSPAEDHQVERIELMRQLVRHPQATFYIRIAGDSMQGAGILDGSVVLVDRALKPRHGHIVIAVVDGEFTCKRLHLHGQRLLLRPENPAYPVIDPKDGQSVEVWGVVVATIHQHV
jgi:DNA polymerase V